MNYVDENLDNVPRQVVPGDFSFLSLADRQVVSAMAKLITTLTGVQDNKPILLGLVAVEKDDSNRKYSFGPATLLYDGMVYELQKISSSGVYSSFARFMDETYISAQRVVAGPSPVYGEGLQKDVDVHYKCVFVPIRTIVGDEFTLSQIQTLPGISDTEGSEGVISRPTFREL